MILIRPGRQDDTVDIIPMAFLDVFNTTGGLPSINLANVSSTTLFSQQTNS